MDTPTATVRNPEKELELRVDEMSPHQRAITVVLQMWGTLSAPVALAVSLVLGTWLAWQRPGFVNPVILLAVYFLVGAPATLALFGAQTAMRKAIARRVLRQLDAPVRGALSGAESSAAFQTTRDEPLDEGPLDEGPPKEPDAKP
jgi:hypothetical protein